MTVASVVGGWLLTYLVHSTLLLGAVALLTWRVVRREAVRETLWKAALVGGVVTATVAVLAPRAGAAEIELAALGAGSAWSGEAAAASDRAGFPDGSERPERPMDGVGAPDTDVDVDGESNFDTDTELGAGADVGDRGTGIVGDAGLGGPAGSSGEAGSMASRASGSAPGAGTGARGGPAGWLILGLIAWAGIAAVLLGRLAYRHARLRWLLRDRRQVPGSEPAAVMLTELRRTAGVWKPVRLTATPAVATPLALGGVEVCVPERFLSELGADEQRAALAHELAHLARRDPAWQLVGSLLSALFFFQPLNGVARKAIRSAAEYLADGWAVSHTGSRVQLARCLAAVAGWVAPSEEPMLAGTVAMAEGGSPLLARVQRLLEHEPEEPTRPAQRLLGALALVAVVAGFAPSLGPSSTTADPGRLAAAPAPRASEPAAGPGSVWIPGEMVSESLDVRRLDGPQVEGDGFVARLNAAGRDARQTPYWVAYAIAAHGKTFDEIVIDSEPWTARNLSGPALSAMLGIAGDLADAKGAVLVLARLVPEGAATRVDRLAARRPDLGMAIGGRVYWLGQADAQSSFRWLRDIQVAVWEEDIRQAAVDAIALHDTPRVDPFLRSVLKNDPSTAVKEEAIEGLALRGQDPGLARLFFSLAMSDPDGGVRREATENLARIGQPELAVELLERLANEAPDRGIQRQAAESLGEVSTDAAHAALRRILDSHPDDGVRKEALDQLARNGPLAGGADLLALALTADSPDLRREAIEAMAPLGAAAVPFLRRAVFESGDRTVEREATEILGRVGGDEALEALREILRQSPSEDAAFQAVESIAENYPRGVAIAALRDLALTHPSSRVRREAVDVLGDLGG